MGEVINQYDAEFKRHGKWFFELGNYVVEGNYINGNKHGLFKYSRNLGGTSLHYEDIEYDTNVRHGVYNQYALNGNLKMTGFYKEGKKHGRWLLYSTETGNLLRDCEYANNLRNGFCVLYRRINGDFTTEFSKGNYLDGFKFGSWEYIRRDGTSYFTEYVITKSLSIDNRGWPPFVDEDLDSEGRRVKIYDTHNGDVYYAQEYDENGEIKYYKDFNGNWYDSDIFKSKSNNDIRETPLYKYSIDKKTYNARNNPTRLQKRFAQL